MPCNGPFSDRATEDLRECRTALHQAERELCEARWLLVRMYEDYVEPAQVRVLFDVRPEDKVVYIQHRSAQLQHRKADQKQVVNRLRQQINNLRSQEQPICDLGGIPTEEFLDEIADLEQHAVRINALTDQQLLDTYWGNEKRLHEELKNA